jgi:hypothetical protein
LDYKGKRYDRPNMWIICGRQGMNACDWRETSSAAGGGRRRVIRLGIVGYEDGKWVDLA